MQPEGERKRAPGGGRKATLRTPQAKLFYLLWDCKCDATVDLLSVLLGFDRAGAGDWVHGRLPVLEQALGFKQALPARKLRSLAAFLARFSAVPAVILDGTERPVQRPKDPEQQREPDAGKQKRHTRQHMTGRTRTKRVVRLRRARAGNIHAKRSFDEEA